MNQPSRQTEVDGANLRGGGRWLRRRVKTVLVSGGVLALLLSAATCTTSPNLAPGVVKKTEQVRLGAELVKVDFYFQAQPEPQPLVVVAHGFTRSKRYMAGWGADLAARGMVVAVLTQPYLAKHQRNAQAIADLADLGRAGEWPVAARGNGKVALVGYSMGGLTTLLAASKIARPIDAWVGLDPVDFEGRGAVAAARLRAPGLALIAEPAPFNRDGNAQPMLKRYGGELQVLKVVGGLAHGCGVSGGLAGAIRLRLGEARAAGAFSAVDVGFPECGVTGSGGKGRAGREWGGAGGLSLGQE
jgi:dienelactone hydrolase